jgi:prephenate dehydratase
MALAAVAAGADGITVEVHPDPDRALSDGPQSLHPAQFEKLMRDIEALAPVLGKEVARLPAPDLRAPRAAFRAAGAAARVAFQGERGAFSEHAARLHFAAEVETVSAPDFRAVFEAVLQARVRWGIVPVENSLTGSIHQNYDLLLQYPDVRIAGEQKIRIVHNLIGFPGVELADIRRVFSHPQGLAQCAAFLEEHPGWERVAWDDTAGAVRHVAEAGDRANAAIASEEAARVHGLAVLRQAIEANPQNYTRFVVIERDDVGGDAEPAPASGRSGPPDKASFCFATADRPGALFAALRVLADRGLNMKKLESRPIPGRPWQYQFYLDVDVPADRAAFDAAVAALRGATEDLRVLGIYRAG